MKILVIGSGGREHALAWKLAQSSRVTDVIVAPGNAGTTSEDKCRNVAVKVTDIDGLLALAQAEGVALTVVGPEVPLVAGVVDRFRAAGLRIFGPTAAAAQLEGSKAYAKDFLARHNIPTAFYAVHTDVDAALAYIREKEAQVYEHVRDVIDRGIASGEFYDCDSHVLALGYIGMTLGSYRWLRPHGRRSAQEIAVEFSTALLRGLIRDEGVREVSPLGVELDAAARTFEESN